MTAPGIRLHPRTGEVSRAARTLADYVAALQDEYQLSYVETAKILAELAADKLKYALRAERHPDDPDRKADEE